MADEPFTGDLRPDCQSESITAVHVITGLLTGGAERALQRLCASMKALGIESTVLALRDGPIRAELERSGLHVSAMSTDGVLRSLGAAFLWRRRAADSGRALVIHGWMYHGNIVALLLGRALGGRVIWGIRQGVAGGRFDSLRTRLVIRISAGLSHFADVVVFNSDRSRREHCDVGFSMSNSVVIENGFEVVRPEDVAAARRQVRAGLGIPESAFVVAHVGRSHPVKNHAMFIEACNVLAAQRPDVHVLMVGRDVECAQAGHLAALRAAAGPDRVHVLGERSDAPYLLCGADLLCVTSWSESFPNVIGEAMGRGIPCISTPVGNVEELVEGCGEVVPFGDSSALAGAMRSWAESAPGTRRRAAGIARRRISDVYSLHACALAYKALYAGHSRGRPRRNEPTRKGD